MESRRPSRHGTSRVAATVAQEVICCIMSSNDDAANASDSNIIKPLKIGIKRDTTTNQSGRGHKSTTRDPESSLPVALLPSVAENSLHAPFKRDAMYEAYQEWVSKTYGDSAKTKTVTRRKYNRIVKILKGEESTSIENSKFRFWVKAKGFKLGPVPNEANSCEEQVLFVPCTKNS
ncbi:Nucleolar protein 4-like protein, partial [Dinothrombium tinctorium]